MLVHSIAKSVNSIELRNVGFMYQGTSLKNDPHMMECIETLNMQSFVNNRDYGYAINDKNTYTSGGEKQKNAILRLLYKNPDVMIFNEPTSAPDAVTTNKNRLAAVYWLSLYSAYWFRLTPSRFDS